MTLKEALNNTDFNIALNIYDFPKAFSFLGYMDADEEREKLFLLIQEEGLNPLYGFTEIPYRFLIWGKHIKHIEIPDSVTSIGDDAFYECSSLTSVVIPDIVTSIGEGAFSECRSLTSVVIPDNITSIGNHTFYNCNSLTSVGIPDGVKSIGDFAFYSCDNLTSVTIGGNVTSIGRCAFDYCSNLTSIEIPDSVTSIGNNAFSSCKKLKEIKYKGTKEQAITKSKVRDESWRENSSIEKIICTNGVINL